MTEKEKNKFYEKERKWQQDMQRMYSWFPPSASYLQKYVDEACDRLDYEGSRMYDEYPDYYMLRRECSAIAGRVREDQKGVGVEAGSCRNCGNMPGEVLEDLIETLFFSEFFRRRHNFL